MQTRSARRTLLYLFTASGALIASARAQDPKGEAPALGPRMQDSSPPPRAQEEPLTLEQLAERVRAVEEKLKERDRELEELKKSLASQPTTAAAKQDLKPAETKWYDKLSIKGYLQFRYTTLLNQDNTPDLHVPADPSVNEPETFFIRRGRVILTGTVTEHLFVFAQVDYNAPLGTGSQNSVQMRDFYGDISIDDDKEHRF
ncbi:MAG: hypothetical protein JNM84_10635, partial [Planctomycetes bacterium]|nr:hypothetical protein [Planctomycetota bacterium]